MGYKGVSHLPWPSILGAAGRASRQGAPRNCSFTLSESNIVKRVSHSLRDVIARCRFHVSESTATTFECSRGRLNLFFIQCDVCRILLLTLSQCKSRHKISKYLACIPTDKCLRGRPCATSHSNSDIFLVLVLDKNDFVSRQTAAIYRARCHRIVIMSEFNPGHVSSWSEKPIPAP